jgi:hypothetical protein
VIATARRNFAFWLFWIAICALVCLVGALTAIVPSARDSIMPMTYSAKAWPQL